MPQVNEFSWMISSLSFIVFMIMMFMWLNSFRVLTIFNLNSIKKFTYLVV